MWVGVYAKYGNGEIDNFNLKQLKYNSSCIIIELGREWLYCSEEILFGSVWGVSCVFLSLTPLFGI